MELLAHPPRFCFAGWLANAGALVLARNGIPGPVQGAVLLALEVSLNGVVGDRVAVRWVVVKFEVALDRIRSAAADVPGNAGAAVVHVHVSDDCAVADDVGVGAEWIGGSGGVLYLEVAADGDALDPDA